MALTSKAHPVIKAWLWIIEPASGWRQFTHVPLADKGGVIAGLLQVFRKENRAIARWLIVVDHAVVVHILAGEYRRPTRRAECRGDKGILKMDTFGGHAIHIRRVYHRVHKAELVVALIVGENIDHVLWFS